MAEPYRIAGIAGSLRAQSYNRRLLETARELAPERLEIEVITLDGVEPYNADVEAEGWPPGVAALRGRIEGCDGVIFATPEYNYSVPGVLKNAIDWLTRPEGEAPLNGKPAAIIGASTSMIGTARAQAHLRQIAFYNGMPLLSTSEVLVARAGGRFAEDGLLTDADSRKFLQGLLDDFADWMDRLRR
jgi:chromate reductase